MSTSLERVQGQLAASSGALITVPTNQRYQITKIDLFNGTGSAVSDVALYAVPTGDAADATTQFAKFGSIPAGEARSVSLSGQVLVSGDALHGVAGTGSAINYRISYQRIAL